jgi:hypothetical protein
MFGSLKAGDEGVDKGKYTQLKLIKPGSTVKN